MATKEQKLEQAIKDLELDIDLLTYYIEKRTYGTQGSLALVMLRGLISQTIYKLKGVE